MREKNIQLVYTFIRQFQEIYNAPPTYQEIVDFTKLGRGTVINALTFLEARGKISREARRPRSIKIL